MQLKLWGTPSEAFLSTNIASFLTYLKCQKSAITLNAGRASRVMAATGPSHGDSAWLPNLFMAWEPSCWWHWCPGGPGRDTVAWHFWQEPAQVPCTSRGFHLLGWGFCIMGLQSQQGWGCLRSLGAGRFLSHVAGLNAAVTFSPVTSRSQRGCLGALSLQGLQHQQSPVQLVESVWPRQLQAERLSPGVPTGLGAASSVVALSPFIFSQRRADACPSALQSFLVNLKTEKVFLATFNFRAYHSLILLIKITNLKKSYQVVSSNNLQGNRYWLQMQLLLRFT